MIYLIRASVVDGDDHVGDAICDRSDRGDPRYRDDHHPGRHRPVPRHRVRHLRTWQHGLLSFVLVFLVVLPIVVVDVIRIPSLPSIASVIQHIVALIILVFLAPALRAFDATIVILRIDWMEMSFKGVIFGLWRPALEWIIRPTRKDFSIDDSEVHAEALTIIPFDLEPLMGPNRPGVGAKSVAANAIRVGPFIPFQIDIKTSLRATGMKLCQSPFV